MESVTKNQIVYTLLEGYMIRKALVTEVRGDTCDITILAGGYTNPNGERSTLKEKKVSGVNICWLHKTKEDCLSSIPIYC